MTIIIDSLWFESEHVRGVNKTYIYMIFSQARLTLQSIPMPQIARMFMYASAYAAQLFGNGGTYIHVSFCNDINERSSEHISVCL